MDYQRNRASIADAKTIFLQHGGMMRLGEATNTGINANTVYSMYREGVVDKVTRGLYRLTDYAVPEEPDFVVIAKKVPRGVICLLSALVYHQITTQIPDRIFVMLDRKGKQPPKLDYPPIHYTSCSSHLFYEGIETHSIGGVEIKLTNPERTLVDCFKHRHKIGTDVAVEALWYYWRRPSMKTNLDLLMHYAKKFRLDKVMQPYIETVING